MTRAESARSRRFQSAPGAEAGRKTVREHRGRLTICFNPLPVQRPGGPPNFALRFYLRTFSAPCKHSVNA